MQTQDQEDRCLPQHDPTKNVNHNSPLFLVEGEGSRGVDALNLELVREWRASKTESGRFWSAISKHW